MPGVSLSRTDDSITLILKTREGNGSITFFPLFSSLMLAYISVSSPVWPAPCLYPSDLHGRETEKSGKENISDSISGRKGPLLLNYCVSGRCEIPLNTGSYVYVKGGDLSLTERSPGATMSIPAETIRGLNFSSIQTHRNFPAVHGSKKNSALIFAALSVFTVLTATLIFLELRRKQRQFCINCGSCAARRSHMPSIR